MADHIRITKAEGTWVVRAGGAVLGETKDALELTVGDQPPAIYFPRGDIAMAFLDRSGKSTTCLHRGVATHYSIVTKSRTLDDVAWSYEDPTPEAERIGGYLAFRSGEAVAVERI